MENCPFFSIIIPLYNKEDYIENTIKSVINQSFKDFEIIIVNDGSTDESLNILKKINDSRIKIYSNANSGLAYSRNYGIKKATAQYIALLDADDLWTNDYLACIFNLITLYKNEFVFATNNHTWFKKTQPNLTLGSEKQCSATLIKDYFSFGKNIFSYSSVVFHNSVFNTIGYFDETVNHGEEEVFSIKCFLKYNLVYCSMKKVFYLKNVKNQLTAPDKNRNRILPDYEFYLNNNTNKDLKKYIDFIHFKLVVLYKMELNYTLVKFYKKKINLSNLSFNQKLKFLLPTLIFKFTKSIYLLFSKRVSHS
jgi:glycosyltransferase involved in cell wall biosynthesis